MSDYNVKNYTEQGGEVTHIGGKLVVDDGADISALVAAISDAGKASIPALTESYLGKTYGDLVEDDVKILVGGTVTGHIKYVTGYDQAFPGEADGYFFPVHLSDEYKGKNIKVKRESGEGDELITTLIDTAERLCRDVARVRSVTSLKSYPAAKPAILYTVAYLYEHREDADHHALTLTLRSLLFGIRKEKF